jgi:4,5-dihydroxyphthalate decarboxylase
MNDLAMTYAGLDYMDRTRALIDGTVKPHGITLRYLAISSPGELFRRVAQQTEFDAAEMSSSTYMNLLARGDQRYTAIPVFPSRCFRHSYVFVHRDSGIEKPIDLKGKKAGIAEYQMTAGVFQRAFLQHDYGVMPQDIKWFQGGRVTPGYVERNAIPNPPGVSIQMIPEHKSLNGMLAAGELDALFSPDRPPSLLDGSGRVRRLFPNWVEIEQDYYRRTGFFPIMHLVVMRRDVYEKNRWIAVSLLDAFIQAQRMSWQRMQWTGCLPVMLPWLPDELERISATMGPKHWPYGFSENRTILTAMCSYHYEQGLSDRRLTPEELFAPETLEHFIPV